MPLNIKSTKEIKIPKKIVEQVIGQDKAVEVIKKAGVTHDAWGQKLPDATKRVDVLKPVKKKATKKKSKKTEKLDESLVVGSEPIIKASKKGKKE